jgi:hypothetical protein
MKNQYFKLSLFIFSIITFLMLIFPFQKTQIEYVNILDKNNNFSLKGNEMTKRMFLDKDGNLFIKNKTVYSSLVLITWIKDESWEKDDLDLLKKLVHVN